MKQARATFAPLPPRALTRVHRKAATAAPTTAQEGAHEGWLSRHGVFSPSHACKWSACTQTVCKNGGVSNSRQSGNKTTKNLPTCYFKFGLLLGHVLITKRDMFAQMLRRLCQKRLRPHSLHHPIGELPKLVWCHLFHSHPFCAYSSHFPCRKVPNLGRIAFRAVRKIGEECSSSVNICRKSLPARNFGQPQSSRVF